MPFGVALSDRELVALAREDLPVVIAELRRCREGQTAEDDEDEAEALEAHAS